MSHATTLDGGAKEMSDTPLTDQQESIARAAIVGDDYSAAFSEILEWARELERRLKGQS